MNSQEHDKPMPSPKTTNQSRLQALEETQLLDSPPDYKFDRFTQLVTAILEVSACLFSLVAPDRQFFKSQTGLHEPWSVLRQTPLSHSFCQHVVEKEHSLVVEDARKHPVLKDNPAITSLNIVAYAGFPISTPEGFVLGSFCAIDDKPRKWTIRDIAVMKGFAEAIESEIGLQLEIARRERAEERLKSESDRYRLKLEAEVESRTAELSKALAKSQAAEERFETLIKRTPQPVAMFDRNLRYLHYSERWVEDYRLHAHLPLTGRSHYDVFPTIPERWKVHHRRVLEGESLSSEEDSFLREDGSREWLRWELVPWRKADGEDGGLIMFTEVQTQRRMEQAELKRQHIQLQEATEKLAQAQRGANIIHWSWDPSTSEVTIGPVEGETELVRPLEQVLDQVKPDFREILRRQLKAALQSSESSSNVEFTTVDGRILIAAGSSHDGKVSGIFQDVTKVRALERQLREAQKMGTLGLLASGLAHDLNNILCGIPLPAEMSKHELPPDHPLQDDLTTIYEAGRRAERLVKQLLVFSRRRVTEARVVDVNQIVENFRGMLSRLLPKRVQLEVKLAESQVPKVLIDPSALEQVILNLVVNAKDAMPEGGTVSLEIDVRQSGKEQIVAIGVVDGGVGIPEGAEEAIFEPFYTTKAIGEGTGLGLSVCRNIIREAAGNISAESRPGLGTRFRIELPYADSLVDSGEDGSDQVTGGNERILLVEEDDALRTLTGKFLRSIGYQLKCLGSPIEALQAVREEQFDVLISEIHLPGLDGREVASECRMIQSNLKAILVSGDTFSGEASTSLLGQRNNFLSKPFTTAQLAKCIRKALDDRPS